MHSTGAQLVPQNVKKKCPELGSDRDWLCRLHSPGVPSSPSSPTPCARACALPLFVWRHCVFASNYSVENLLDISRVIVSTGSIRWILWFSVRYAAAARREIFGVNALRGKQQQLGSPNLQDIFIVSFSGKENSLILKNKMAAPGISLKIIYIFLLAVPHR